MADDGNDILMRLIKEDGKPLLAECQTEIDTDYDDFVSDYFNGEFFEISSFDFGFSIEDKDPVKDAVNAGTNHAHAQPQTQAPRTTNVVAGGRAAPPSAAMASKMAKEEHSSPFHRWKAATPDELKKMKRYPVKMQEFNITRTFDKASPVLFKAVCDSATFQSASMVKRKVTGTDKLRGFLRLEFKELLVTHVGWSNSEPLQEKFKFIFREVKVRYRKTTYRKGESEAVLTEIDPAEWKYDAELKNREMSL